MNGADSRSVWPWVVAVFVVLLAVLAGASSWIG